MYKSLSFCLTTQPLSIKCYEDVLYVFMMYDGKVNKYI
jgi:hypothetical protein